MALITFFRGVRSFYTNWAPLTVNFYRHNTLDFSQRARVLLWRAQPAFACCDSFIILKLPGWPESLFPPALSAHLSIFTERRQAPLDAIIY